MVVVCGKTLYQLVCRFGNVGRSSAKEGLGTNPGSGWEGISGNKARVGGLTELGTLSLAVWEGGVGSF
jgi:hypothetical protein